MSSSSTSSSEPRRLAARLILLALPFALWLGFPVVVLWASGELTVSIGAVVQRQAGAAGPTLFAPAYSNPNKVFKLRSAQRRGARVLALGTSVVMQFRAGFFRDPEGFYNAGGGIVTLWEMEEFLKRLPPERGPELILLGLDQCQFNRAWEDPLFQTRAPAYDDYRDPNPLRVIQDNWRAVYKAYGDGKFTLAGLAGRPGVAAFGLRALAEGGGFRNDGSQCFGTSKHAGAAHPASWDYRFHATLDRVDHNGNRFEYAREVAPERVAMLGPFLDECRRRNIHVVAFLPPLAPTVWQRMLARGDDYAYVPKIVPAVGPLFARRGFTLHDFTDAAAFGATDAEFLDGYHAGERVNLRMQLALAGEDSVLARLVDGAALARLLREGREGCSVFED
jgi:hypothetical protein